MHITIIPTHTHYTYNPYLLFTAQLKSDNSMWRCFNVELGYNTPDVFRAYHNWEMGGLCNNYLITARNGGEGNRHCAGTSPTALAERVFTERAAYLAWLGSIKGGD